MNVTQVSDLPITVQFDFTTGLFAPAPDFSERRVSDLAAMFYDRAAVTAILAGGDRVVYDVRYHPFATSVSDMAVGVTRIFPGTVGDEYHMTKGHYHARADQPEIYFCVAGEGYLLLETRDGEFRAERWTPGSITHIAPTWAHRTVNTGKEVLTFVAVFHLAAGHDYAPIVQRGFAQVVVERNGQPVFMPNPRR